MERVLLAVPLAAIAVLSAACSLGFGAGDAAPAVSTSSPTVALSTPTRPAPSPTAIPSPAPPTPTARPTSQPIPAEIAARVESVLPKAAAVRSLPVKDRVPISLLPRDQFRAYLLEKLEQDKGRSEMEKDQALFVLLDLLREDDDLYRLWLNLLSEQVVGLYEPDTGEMKLVGVGDRLSAMDEVTLVHEYTHALQDQNFDAGSRLKRAKGAGERVLGLQSLMEGDATLVGALYARQSMSPEQQASLARESAGFNQDRLRSAPMVVQTSLLFPYLQGASFVGAMLQSGGWAAVDRVYANPPVTSEQVLHVDKFKAGEGPVEIKAPDLAGALGSQWSLSKEDTLGELGMLIYLASGVGAEEAMEAAEGWGGDRTFLFRSSSGYRYAMATISVWDTPEDAREFYEAVRELRVKKGPKSVSFPNEKSMVWTAPFRNGYASLDGSRVVLVITPDEPTTKKLVAAVEAGR